ncbi:iron-containing alcohol dehydrogenase [Alkalihalobacterium chitinilyticum]|uniref:Iron-containing alcohol dehydrogenase n=1 Tax=Alkalihalobacterium chitinilyticum TaxID=2980103 RepID=A0ABT5VJ39_9BACI|nr:iron-containing alcohol dehydrogenase [Alkalihalobacterium chitinilyticum]MDE5415434.1 iron-containing alcohol dehydrogenase [Alkalihalobacterium chitinilyticum]
MQSKLIFPELSHVGLGVIDKLNDEVKKLGGSKILVVTEKNLVDIGICSQALQSLDSASAIEIYTDVVPEPPLHIAEKLLGYIRREKFDLIIGVGGGSALDLAKLGAVLAQNEGEVKDYLNLTGTKQVQHKGLPKIMIPTTAGTGSEVTDIAVLSLEGTKDVVTHPYLISDVAIVDPVLTMSVPPKITAATGIDALTHAIEAYISVNSSAVTDGIAEKAIELIGASLERAFNNGSDEEAREQMSTASYMAGLAFYNAGVGGVHALAYPLGNRFKLPHGESNAVLLPYVMNYIQEGCKEKLANVYLKLTQDVSVNKNEELSTSCVQTLFHLNKKLKIPTDLKEYGIEQRHLEMLTDDAMKQKRLLARSPVKLEWKDIFNIYSAAYEGKMS